jgi:hypothetical protein
MIAQARQVIVALALLASGAATAEAPPLRYNPFSRPPSDVYVPGPGIVTAGPVRDIEVTATMVSAGTRLAHVSGTVMRAGDEIFGNKLLRVYEDRAVFLTNGEERTVYVKPELEEDYEEVQENRRR